VTPDVSVVVPSHNRRDLLRLTLRSILSQRGVHLEVIVVDDGSSDGTGAMVDSMDDARLRLIRHERATGVSSARNDGVAAARGTWIAFCDDDDLWAADKLVRQCGAAAQVDSLWAYGGSVRIDTANAIISGDPPPAPEVLVGRLPFANLMPGGSSNAIVRADALADVGGWDTSLINLADWDLWIRLARLGPPACVVAPLVAYRIHHGNRSADTALILREARLLGERHGNTVDYGALHHYLAWVCLRSGRRLPALRHFVQAAAGGRLGEVSRNLGPLLGARLARVWGGSASAGRAQSRWISEAESWIGPFREL
jgi:glycosyltransferase involved in cell wall biosynthesis